VSTGQSALTTLETTVAVVLASTSGAAVLAHTFGPLPMSLTVPFIVMPSVAILGSTILLARGMTARFHRTASLLMLGMWTGFLATVAYDVSRLALRAIFDFRFNPFGAIPIFGELMTGLARPHPFVQIAGWSYHFWNGISFGMMFAVLRPKGGVIAGIVWGLGLAILMLVTYPHLLNVSPDDPGFLAADLIGHTTWGLVLGWGVRKWSPYA
jgi:uncharacterized membrane protein (DUF485 family)